MNGDILDLIFAGIVLLGGFNGYRLGIVRQVTRLFGAVVAYFVSYWLHPYVAAAMQNMHLFSQSAEGNAANLLFGGIAGAVSFGLVFIVTFLLLRYAAGLVDALFRLPVLSFFNRLLGLVAGVALALIFVFVASLILHYINTPWIQEQVQHSLTVNWLAGNLWNTVAARTSVVAKYSIG